MSRPRLIALDLDGTLLGPDHQISERAARAVGRAVAAGATVVLCTGRPPRMTHAYGEALQLEQSIVYNGASVLDHRDRSSVHHHALSAETTRQIVTRLREGVAGIGIGLETAAGWFVDEVIFEDKRVRLESAGLPLPDGVGPVEQFVSGGAIKVFARHPERSVTELAAVIEDVEAYATWTGKYLLEVMHHDVNKRDALIRFSEALGIEAGEVAAFGDNHNDVQMLAWAGHGVAMANASPGALEAASHHTASNEEDGVAQFLERWFG